MAESEVIMNLIPKPVHVDTTPPSDDSEIVLPNIGKVNIGNPQPPHSIDSDLC